MGQFLASVGDTCRVAMGGGSTSCFWGSSLLQQLQGQFPTHIVNNPWSVRNSHCTQFILLPIAVHILYCGKGHFKNTGNADCEQFKQKWTVHNLCSVRGSWTVCNIRTCMPPTHIRICVCVYIFVDCILLHLSAFIWCTPRENTWKDYSCFDPKRKKVEFDDTVTVKERERYCSNESNWKGS